MVRQSLQSSNLGHFCIGSEASSGFETLFEATTGGSKTLSEASSGFETLSEATTGGFETLSEATSGGSESRTFAKQ